MEKCELQQSISQLFVTLKSQFCLNFFQIVWSEKLPIIRIISAKSFLWHHHFGTLSPNGRVPPTPTLTPRALFYCCSREPANHQRLILTWHTSSVSVNCQQSWEFGSTEYLLKSYIDYYTSNLYWGGTAQL